MKTRAFSLLAGSLLALALIGAKAHAFTKTSNKATTATSDSAQNESWGDLGYTRSSADTPVEAMTPETAPTDNDRIAAELSAAELEKSSLAREESAASIQEVQIQPKGSESRPITQINSTQNTYGVETEETHAAQIYLAPFGGVTSLFGADSVSSSMLYSAGVSAGVLLSDRFLIEGSFTHTEMNLSANYMNNVGYSTYGADAYGMKENQFSAGGRFFFTSRESRIRPYAGGGITYSRGSLSYNSTYLALVSNQAAVSNDLTLNQYEGYGKVGAEIAITRNIVADIAFQVNGILSSNTSSDAGSADSSRMQVSNTLGSTASYLAVAGVGFYF